VDPPPSTVTLPAPGLGPTEPGVAPVSATVEPARASVAVPAPAIVLSPTQMKIKQMVVATNETEEVCNFYLECMGGDVDQATAMLKENQAQTR
jgi:hypothetical protein